MFPIDVVEYIPIEESEEEDFCYTIPHDEHILFGKIQEKLATIIDSLREYPREEEELEIAEHIFITCIQNALLEIYKRVISSDKLIARTAQTPDHQ